MKNVNGKIFNKLSMVAMVSIIFVAAMAAMSLPVVKANGNSIYVDPPYQEILVCTNFTVYVNLTSLDEGSHSVTFNLSFDPNLVECINATNTSFPSQILSFLPTINNTTGFVNVTINTVGDIIGSGTIAEITFHCKGAGTSFLNFSSAKIGPRTITFRYNGTCSQVIPPVGGEVLTIDALPLLIPWIAVAGAVAVATVLVLANRRTINR
jgi:hypothetical protein